MRTDVRSTPPTSSDPSGSSPTFPAGKIATLAPIAGRIIRELAAYRLRLACYVLLLAAAAVGGVCVPLLTQRLVDDGLVPRHGDVVTSLSIAILVVGLGSVAVRSAGGARATRRSRK